MIKYGFRKEWPDILSLKKPRFLCFATPKKPNKIPLKRLGAKSSPQRKPPKMVAW